MKKKIFIIATSIILLTIAIGIIIIKPKYELNKAVQLIKEGDYSKAFTYISNKGNKENIEITKELISMALLEYMSGGLEQITTIATKGTKIIENTNMNNIDYSSDDTLNIYVKKLEDYISIKNKISKEMVIEDMTEIYDLYFEVLEFVNTNFTDFLNHIDNKDFINKTSLLPTKLENIAIDITSIEHNYIFNQKTKDIYKEINL